MSGSNATVHPDETHGHEFRAVVSAETIQTTVALVEALFDECHVHVDEDGLRFSAVDPATVASVDLGLERSAFEAFDATSHHVGVNVSRLGDVVGMADRGQPVTLALDSETRKLEIRIGELEYTLALLDPETIRSPPDRSSIALEFAGRVVTEAGDFDRAVRAAEMVSDHLAFGIDDAEDAFYVEAEGDTDDVSLTVPAEDLVEFEPGDAHSLFSVDYLAAIDRAIASDLDVELRLGVEQPLELRAEFADGAGTVEYLVSPRISTR